MPPGVSRGGIAVSGSRHPIEFPGWNRRSRMRGTAALGLGSLAAGSLVANRAAAQSTPIAQGGHARCDPLALLPKTASFQVTSADVHDGAQMPKAQMSGIFGAGGDDR